MGILLSAAQRFLTPQLLGRMASAVGIDPKLAQTAASAAIPAILASLSQVASTPNGAERLSGAVSRAPTGMLDDLGSRLSNPSGMIEQGQSMLSSLLGSNASNTLTSTLARFVGGGEGSMGSLIGLLMPVLMGVLGRQQQTTGGNGAGLARQLRSEAGDFKAAMPSGLSSLLDSSGFFDQLGATQTAASQTTREDFGERAARERTPQATSTPTVRSEPAHSTSNWAYWALPLALIIGGLIGYMWGGDQRARDTTAAYQTTDVASARPMESYLRQTVVSDSGEPLGTVEDVLITPNGQVMAVLSTAQPLGLGEKRVAVPMTSLETATRDGGTQIVFKGSKESLVEAPAVSPPTGSSRVEPTRPGTTGTLPTPQSSPGTSPSPQGAPPSGNQ